MSQRGVRLCPFYQIEFNAVAAGKTIAMSKRHIRWRFGFPNIEAVESGKTGTACRGVEHEVTVVWSVTSGKRRIMADNQEIHTSMIRSGALEHSWVMSNNHVVKIIAHSTASNQTTGRQYDLLVDGQSYFSVPKVFELGIKGHMPSRPINDRRCADGDYATRRNYSQPPPTRDINQPTTPQQEEEDLRLAIEHSLKESRELLNSRSPNAPSNVPGTLSPNKNSRPATAPNGQHDLLDLLGGEPTPPPAQHAMVPVSNQPPTQWGQSNGAPPPNPHRQVQYAPQAPEYQQPVGAYGDTVSLPPGADAFAPRDRNYTDVSSQIMQAYSGQPATTENMNGLPAQISVMQQPMGHQGQYSNQNKSVPPRQSSFHSQPNPQQYANNAVQPQFYQNNMQAPMQQVPTQQAPMQQPPMQQHNNPHFAM